MKIMYNLNTSSEGINTIAYCLSLSKPVPYKNQPVQCLNAPQEVVCTVELGVPAGSVNLVIRVHPTAIVSNSIFVYNQNHDHIVL